MGEVADWLDDGQIDDVPEELEPIDYVKVFQEPDVFMYGEVAIAFAPFQVGERAHFPIEFWLKHRQYLRPVSDGTSRDQPHEG